MPRRRNSLTAAFSIRRARSDANADSRSRRQLHPMLALDLPDLDRALHGGFPFNRVTEIIGAGEVKSLLAARAIASLQRQVPESQAVWLDMAGDLDHDRLLAVGVDERRLSIVHPETVGGFDRLDPAIGHTVHVFVLSGLAPFRRGDYLYAGILQQLAITANWTRAVILVINEPGGDKSPLDRLAAVRIRLSNEAEDPGRAYTATATIIKNRFGNGAVAVPLAIALK